jgi:hypothetical protein
VNRTFLIGLVSVAIGVASGFVPGAEAYVADSCAGLMGRFSDVAPCADAGSWTAFLNVFTLVTLMAFTFLAVAFVPFGKRYDGIVGIGDALMALGGVVVLVEVAVFVVEGNYVAVAYGAFVLALVVFAEKMERQASMATSFVMGFIAASWVITDPSAWMLGTAPALLWTAAGCSYVASLKVGEEAI